MTVTTSVLANDGGAPARIINFTAAEDITAGTAMEIDSNGKVQGYMRGYNEDALREAALGLE